MVFWLDSLVYSVFNAERPDFAYIIIIIVIIKTSGRGLRRNNKIV